jgi:hypothetical protein
MRWIAALPSLSWRLISPLAGNSFMRSSTSADKGLPESQIVCVTSNHGIMPLSA